MKIIEAILGTSPPFGCQRARQPLCQRHRPQRSLRRHKAALAEPVGALARRLPLATAPQKKHLQPASERATCAPLFPVKTNSDIIGANSPFACTPARRVRRSQCSRRPPPSLRRHEAALMLPVGVRARRSPSVAPLLSFAPAAAQISPALLVKVSPFARALPAARVINQPTFAAPRGLLHLRDCNHEPQSPCRYGLESVHYVFNARTVRKVDTACPRCHFLSCAETEMAKG